MVFKINFICFRSTVMKINNNVITHYRALFSISVLSLAVIACGGSDSSTKYSSEETSETTSALSKDSIDISDGNIVRDIRGGNSLFSSYVFGYNFDSIIGPVISDRCRKNGFLRGVFKSDSHVSVGYVYILSGIITLNLNGQTDSGKIKCNSNGGDSLRVGSVKLTYEVVNNGMRLTLN